LQKSKLPKLSPAGVSRRLADSGVSAMTTLTLHLKKQYFDAIADGIKIEEYRRITPYWKKRIEGKNYETITLLCGYPRRGDESKTLILPWRGYEPIGITHPHFGKFPVDVYAIRVEKESDKK
jgi:hypothetical protein